MANPIYDDCFILNLKQYSIVPDTQAVLWGEIRESLNISLQIVAHLVNPCKNLALNTG